MRTAQGGSALIVVLMLLIIVTLLGLAGIRGALLQERMAANSNARSFAFQMSEAVLREAEAFALSKPPAPASGCTNGVCAPASGVVPAWQAPNFWTTNSGWKVSQYKETRDGTEITSKYVVEKYGENPGDCTDISARGEVCPPTLDIYRITVRTAPPDGGEVILQSLYQVQ